jgi:hypothetical protein
MSWHPHIWIKAEDYSKVEERYKTDKYSAWKFSIGGVKGVVLYGSQELSDPNRNLHAFLLGAEIPHWIINGEGNECEECGTWGDVLRDDDE